MNDQPTKTRPGDQPLPTPGHECVQDHLIALIEERKQLGRQRYGSPLMTHNGRDAGRDAVEEALDLTVYSMQVAMELRDLRAQLASVNALYEQWVKAGPPPLGAPLARWWDRRLAELHNALSPTDQAPDGE
jgi:hypothetical protein